MNQADESATQSEIIPARLAIRAMRDSGYRNTAYALAELIDNAVQAASTTIDVICVEALHLVQHRERRRIQAIGVVDNGTGMEPNVLQIALQFGNGTRLHDRTGIGRFGMGLPNSSISQCRRLRVWTWQNGPDNAMYSYLDVDEIEKGELWSVPPPLPRPLPEEWRARTDILDTQGTLVVWDRFDDHRLTWRGARATLRNTETLVGRMYRKFLDAGSLAIRLMAFDEGGDRTFLDNVRVNDPLYLTANSSTPPPFDDKPMFQKWGEKDEEFKILYDGVEHVVTARMSWARPETIPEDQSDRGSKPYGKHAAKNLGVSIVRAGRELDLDAGWTSTYDPRDRWWGVEVEFPPALDEVFGVTNNKQSATTFSQMAQFDWKSEADPGETERAFRERIQAEGDPRAILMPIVSHVQRQIAEMQKRVRRQGKDRRKKAERHDAPTVEDFATKKFGERAAEGHTTKYDGEKFSEQDRDSFAKDLKDDKHYDPDVAQAIANATFERGRRVVFLTKAMDGYAFFSVEHPQGGLTSVVFNTNHPFYDQLVTTLLPEIGDETDADLIDRIDRAADTLRLLFAAWARYEMEELSLQPQLFDMRQEWGKMTRVFMTERGE